jgi:hypothetical protein
MHQSPKGIYRFFNTQLGLQNRSSNSPSQVGEIGINRQKTDFPAIGTLLEAGKLRQTWWRVEVRSLKDTERGMVDVL